MENNDDHIISIKFVKMLKELSKIDCYKPRAVKILQHKTHVSSFTRRIFVLWLENLSNEKNKELKNGLVFRTITQQEFLSKFDVTK